MSIFDFLNPVKDIVALVNGVISKFVADPSEKLALQQAVLEAQTALQVKALDLQAQVASAQAQIITAEATSSSWLEKDWRPLLMLFFAVVIAFAIFNGGYDLSGRAINPTYVDDALTIVKIGVGGYVAPPPLETPPPSHRGAEGGSSA